MKFNIKWDIEDYKSHLDEFYNLYNQKPINNNDGGMKSAHMFASWFIIKKTKPKFLIESGVWKGLGTWFFEKASPETKIISIDPELKFREYISPKVKYQSTDFLLTDWSFLPTNETFIFFDDHQNFLERMKCVKKWGFKKIMYEDNYPIQQGDCYTPKKIIANQDFIIDKNGIKNKYQKNNEDFKFFVENVNIYQEMPPIFKDSKTRWGDEWNENYPTPEPLLQEIDKNKYPVFYSEKKDYTWICYMEIN